ncbi:MAG: NADH-quinone oxidoreductase subunit H [Candidatus Obscuribacterales bacterium]|nr:NADH-quinone oxidoreductase subunit H [Candidatus Obscuribacterales bacterium]
MKELDPNEIYRWLIFLPSLLILPALVLGLLRKTKARLQNRIGAPLFQLLFDLKKLSGKGETLSDAISWIFRSTAALNLSMLLLLSLVCPWLVFKPALGTSDLFYVMYVFAAIRFFTLLAALDSASPFAAFGASREATLSILVEPALMLSFAALAVNAKSSELSRVFEFAANSGVEASAIWAFAGMGILLSSLVELSRMPIDDPTTHLELTMVHEAMILEASGRTLALLEYGQALRMTILFGLVTQCFMHVFPAVIALSLGLKVLLSFLGILFIAISLGIFEVLSVKLRWRRNPDFIAYALTMGLLASLIAVGKGLLS